MILFRDKTLEALVLSQQKLIQELMLRCDNYDKQFESIRIRLSKPDTKDDVIEIGKGSNWLEDRRRLESKFAAEGSTSDVMITPVGRR